jgi:hypothetical protein
MSIDDLIKYLILFLFLDIVTTKIGLAQDGIYETNEMMLSVVESIPAMVFVKFLFLIAVLVGVELIRQVSDEQLAKIPIFAVLLIHIYIVITNILLIV